MPDKPLEPAYAAAVQTYLDHTPGSRALALRARRVFPGGNTRTCVHQHPHPLAGQRGHGSFLWDVDDNRYIDLYLNGLSLIHGHAYPPIVERLQQTIPRGTAWSATSDEQIAFAELLCARLPSAERVRFCSSGTEAGMLAAKLCRRATGRTVLLKADVGYHGAADDLEAGLHGQGELPGRTLLAPYGDADAFERVLADRGDGIAAVFIEPASVSTAVAPPAEFFTRLRAATTRAGALLVFDECITFRNAFGGMQETLGVTPDLTMLAKFIGGGLPLGALVGRTEVMQHFDPDRKDHLYHSGSFNGALAPVAAGLVALTELTPERIAHMNAAASRLVAALDREASRRSLPLSLSRAGSLVGLNPFGTGAPGTPSAHSRDAYRFLQIAALNHGVYLQPDEGVLGFATDITDALVDDIAERLGAALHDLVRWEGERAA